ncbi:hypothetical protein NL676_009719 [Syzygium grande]|nr:hypothetical protein NL676_009719 [Syzygium grande]
MRTWFRSRAKLGRSSRVTDDGISALSQKLQRLSRIDVSGNGSVSDQSLVVLSVNCPSLREVGFRECGLITGRGVASLITNRPHLVSLALDAMEEGTIFCEELVNSFRHARGLSSLDFSGSFIWDDLLMSVAKADIPLKSLDLSDASAVICDHLCGLTSVNVNHCFNLTKTILYNLMRRCSSLRIIFMEKTNLRKDDANVTDIVVNSQVRCLIISSNVNLTDECLKKIGRICPNLRYLDVGDCLKITGDGISGVLKSCPEIKYLMIRGLKNIGNLCIDFELPQLEVLQAEGLKLNNKQLAAFISRCCHLKHLDLQKCVYLSTKGVEKVVKNCNTLREINLRDCHNVRDDVPFLDWMVSVRPSLRRIVPPRGSVSSKIYDFLRRGCLVSDD